MGKKDGWLAEKNEQSRQKNFRSNRNEFSETQHFESK